MPSEPSPPASPTRASLGERLRLAREERGISLQDIAQRTKIAVASLDALEHDNPSRLPSGIFARSFVRAYAVEVGLDPDQTLREFVRRFPEHAPPGSETDEEPGARTDSGSSLGRMLVVFLVLAAIGAAVWAGFWWWPTRQVPSMTPGPSGPAVRVPPSPSSAPPSPAPRVEPPSTDAGAGSTGATGEAASPVQTAEAPAAGPSATPSPVPPAADAAPSQPAPVLPAGVLRIEVHPTGPCWVRLEVDGRVVLERLMQPGERVVRDASSAVSLQVGDAGAFAYTVNGQAGRSLGPAGRVARAEITTGNVGTFIAR